MRHFAISRLAQIDVRWADHFVTHESFVKSYFSNPHYQLMIVTEGPIYLMTDEDKLVLNTGEVLLITPWQQHKGWKDRDRPGSYFWVQFVMDPPPAEIDITTPLVRSEGLAPIRDKTNGLRSAADVEIDALLIPSRFRPTNRYDLFRLFEKLVNVTQKPEEFFRFHLTLLLGEILRLIAIDFLNQNQVDTSLPKAFMTYRRIVKVLNQIYLHDNTKELLEKRVGLTYEYLCQIFKKYSRSTITAYVNEMRIQKAKHLLLNTAHDIQRVGELVGFHDPYYFSRVFKKVAGVNPTQFRQKC